MIQFTIWLLNVIHITPRPYMKNEIGLQMTMIMHSIWPKNGYEERNRVKQAWNQEILSIFDCNLRYIFLNLGAVNFGQL